ncbi:hypothetical protein TREMEDRAFT_28837, partial [Tremella mesenterica DSM 1558]|uniref:uncharacterized protein n=1 Tax=Tremella mesenterica (strain ATCC 24925 / CBS 8224 / DSM 1558 / NBRC 9311 / NRRL Y-6157 / RJB 2259-6 / UBC 559-6) TaxID=578456 RepID=UPI0003F48F06
NAPRRLSVEQETRLISKINDFAARGTLLTPRHVKELAESVCAEKIGVNWVSRFVHRHQDVLSSRFYSYKEASRLKADTPAVSRTTKAFYTLVKEVYETGLYSPSCIFNMDESPFSLSYEQRVRRIGPRNHPHNGQAIPSSREHITAVHCIGIDSAPVPPLIIFQGAQLQESWTAEHEKDVRQIATVSNSGWINSYIMIQWLETVFDPFTKDIANGRRRLLFLDGAEPHTKVDFLEACWAKNIVCIILPANMTDKFQPLDVDFFKPLKDAYFRHLNNYQLGGSMLNAVKGMFWPWHQRAWRETATLRQLRGAWRKSGLWPLDRKVMRVEEDALEARPVTPPPRDLKLNPLTPYNLRVLRSNNRAVRRGEIPTTNMLKLEKSCEILLADKALTDYELMSVRDAQALERATRASRKKQRHPDGQLYDPEYAEEHAAELQERKQKEAEARRKRRRTEGRAAGGGSEHPQACIAGPSNTSQSCFTVSITLTLLCMSKSTIKESG